MSSAHLTKGFTIIELLVVVAIMSLLLGTLMVSFVDPKKNTRDDKRLAQVRQLASALELYSLSTGKYPLSPSVTTITGTDVVSAALFQESLLAGVLSDPLTPTYQYQYQSNTTGTIYQILFCLETERFAGYALGCGNVYTP